MDTAEAGYEQMLKQIEEDYKTEVKLIKEECATAAAALKERLIKELEEEKKQIELERYNNQTITFLLEYFNH